MKKSHFILQSIPWTAASLLVGVLTTPLIHAFVGGDHSGGGGVAEQIVRYTADHMDQLLKMCAANTSCADTPYASELVQKIQSSLAQAPLGYRVRFKSEKNEPGFFIVKGEVRSAKTGFQTDSPIYINSDLLYTTNSQGNTQPMDLPTAAGLLLHELGHNQGEKSESRLIALGARLQGLLSRQDSWVKDGFGNRIIFLNPDVDWGCAQNCTPLAFIQTATDFLEIDPGLLHEINDKIKCGFEGTRESSPVGIELSNLHSIRPHFLNSNDPILWLYFRGDIKLACNLTTKGMSATIEKDRYQWRLGLEYRLGQDGILHPSSTLSAEVLDCSVDASLCE